jgi:succinate-semialdehyde dehydrogenase/glutarate-semialdehyde dehydrogenase
MKIHNPASGAAIADVPADTSATVRGKYHRARAAQPQWAALPIKKRLATIAAFRDRLAAMHEALARTLTEEWASRTGSPATS